VQVIVDEIVTEVVVEPGPEDRGSPEAADPEALRELVLRLVREELERNRRRDEGV
jgi:hypothetical protein